MITSAQACDNRSVRNEQGLGAKNNTEIDRNATEIRNVGVKNVDTFMN